MNVTITARHGDLADPMRDHAQRKADWFGQHFDFVTDLQVTLSRGGLLHSAEIIALSRKGERVLASASGKDMYLTFDAAAEKMERRLRKLKERIKSHRPPGAGT